MAFNEVSRAYKADPSIENYVKLRRTHPQELIDIAIGGGIEWLFGNQELLEKFNISPDLVAHALDADYDAISELSLTLMERLIEKKKEEKSGKTHLASRGLAISEALVNYLINLMISALSWNNELHIHRDLLVLIRHQVGGTIDSWEKNQEKKDAAFEVLKTAFDLIAAGQEPSCRAIGKVLGVSQTTVMRRFPKGDELLELLKQHVRRKESAPSVSNTE